MHPGAAPALLWERFAPGHGIGHHLCCYDEVPSTMDVAWQAVESGAPHGTAVLALSQTAGRGRFGRDWVARRGQSLMLSVVVMPDPSVAARLSIVSGLAVVRAVEALTGIRPTLKWPNDVRLAGKKAAGVLIQGRVDTEGRSAAVIGIGLNLSIDFTEDAELRETATSLAHATGRAVEVSAAAVAVLDALDRLYTDAADGSAIVDEWRAVLDTLGSKVSARFPGGEEAGVAEDVAADGSLLLRRDDGVLVRLDAGEVSLQA